MRHGDGGDAENCKGCAVFSASPCLPVSASCYAAHRSLFSAGCSQHRYTGGTGRDVLKWFVIIVIGRL